MQPHESSQRMCSKAFLPVEKPSEELRALLLDAITTQTSPGVRYCGVQWATKLFPFSDPSARYICILAAGDKKIEVSEAGLDGLKPDSFAGALSSDKSANAPVSSNFEQGSSAFLAIFGGLSQYIVQTLGLHTAPKPCAYALPKNKLIHAVQCSAVQCSAVQCSTR